MKRVSNYLPLTSPYGYGWAGTNINNLSDNLKAAGVAFGKLREGLKFDAIAFTGSSGAAIAFYLGIEHKIPLIYVRKKNEDSHGYPVEGTTDAGIIKKYLIVDDFVQSGATVNRIITEIKEYAVSRFAYPAEPVGVFCFEPYGCQRSRHVNLDGIDIPIFMAKDIN